MGVAQLVRALVCGTSCRGFESHHPPQYARVAELVDALVLGTSTFGVRVRVSPLVFLNYMKKNFLLILALFLLSSCTDSDNYKFIQTKSSNFCLSNEYQICINAIKTRCALNFSIKAKQKYEYYIDSDRIIVEFACSKG